MFNVILFGQDHHLRKCCKKFNCVPSTLHLHKFSEINLRYSITASSNETRATTQYVRVPCISSNRIHLITYKKGKRNAITWSDHKVAQFRYSVVASFSIYASSRMWEEWIKIFVLRVCLCACLKVFCSGWIFLRFSFFFNAFAILINFATTTTTITPPT